MGCLFILLILSFDGGTSFLKDILTNMPRPLKIDTLDLANHF
jgi:hypothetical protein